MGSLFLQRLCMLGALELVLLLSLMHGSFAQSSNCSLDILTPLFPCLPYIQPGNTSTPSSDCCTPLKSLIATADPACLCQIPPLAAQIGVIFNESRVLEVVSLCNQTVPQSISSCLANQATTPVGAPSPASTSLANPAPPPQRGNENSGVRSGLSPPYSLLLIGSIFVALFLHLSSTSLPI